jgi:hypothetical protein
MSTGLEGFTTEELLKIKAGDVSGLSKEKLQILQGILSQSLDIDRPPAPAPAPALSQPLPEVPTQRLRSTLQGVTLGSADEMEARLRASVTGEDYGKVLAEIQGKLKAYQAQSPYEALGYEALGGIGSAAAITAATGGAAAPLTGPRVATSVAPLVRALAGTSALGGAQGGITGFMTGEGDFAARAARVPGSTMMGASIAPVVQAAFMGAGKLTDMALDAARRLSGGRGGKAAEAEIQRLAEQTGLTTDELVQRIASGEILAENQTLLQAVRAMYTQGGKASTTIQSALSTRPDTLRREALTDMQQKLVSGLNPNFMGPRPNNENVLRFYRATKDEAQALENKAYEDVWKTGGIIGEDLLVSLKNALQRSPGAANDINTIYTAATGKKPFFSFDKDGNILFSRTPNLKDAEIIRRGIKTSIDSAYTGGKPEVGMALKPVESDLRAAIDASSPKLAATRAEASQLRTAKTAFEEGKTIFNKSADEVQIMMEDMASNSGAVNAFRAGAMDAIRAKMTTGRAKSMMGVFNNPETKEGAVLRTIYPSDELDGILTRIGTAAQSQVAKNRVLGGSDTASSVMQAAKIGSTITADEVANAVSGNPMAGLRIVNKMLGESNKAMSEKDRERVAQILISQDPDIVRKALRDESGMARLQQAVAAGARMLSKTVPYGASYIGETMPRPGLLSQ